MGINDGLTLELIVGNNMRSTVEPSYVILTLGR